MTKDGYIKINHIKKQRRCICLVPLFLVGVTAGFLFEVFFYEALSLSEFRKAIFNIPAKWQSAISSPPLVQNILPSQDNISNQDIEFEFDIITNKSTLLTGAVRHTKLWEKPTLGNLNNFTWKMNNVNICKHNISHASRIMPILVHTARSHFRERLAIRRSYGSIPPYKNWIVRLIFLMGEADRGENPDVNQQQFEKQERELQEEQSIFGDLVIGSFTDTYHNLTYKHLMGYKWVLNFCTEAAFIMKVDDDMFFDIMTWLDWRTAEITTQESNSSAVLKDLYCHTMGGTGPIREKGSKWYVSEEQWPDSKYPDYCSGLGYALTLDLLQKLYSVSSEINFFWVDDVFATGALMEAAKIKYGFTPNVKHIWDEVTSNVNAYQTLCENRSWDDKRPFKAVAFVSRSENFERDMICMWNKTLHDSNYDFQSVNKL